MPGSAFLTGDRVTLRSVEPEDYAFVAEHRNRPTIRRNTAQYDPRSASDVREMIEDGDDSVAFLPSVDGEPVGYAWAFAIDDVIGRATIGYWIVEEERGEGYATETVDLLSEWAFVDRGLHRLQAHVFETNPASMRVLEKAGFEREGTLRDQYLAAGEHVDATLFGLLAEEW